MPATHPATIATNIGQQLHAQMSQMGHFYDADSFILLRIDAENKKLMSVDPAGFYRNLAVIAHMRGNLEALEAHLLKAQKINKFDVDNETTRVCLYANLGFASKALEFFNNSVDIKHGNLSQFASNASGIGAFQRSIEIMQQASLAKLELPNLELMTALNEAGVILRDQGVADALCAKIIDVAGEVLRSRKLFWLNPHPAICVNKASRTVAMCMAVDVSPDEAANMTMETATKLIALNLDSAAFYVSFRGEKK